ncbi:MAG: hypothetical protein NTY67_15365 [Cyanobacteria bacterium]|nr:hypothetical protein [Cyanobacteriota bacterium]
MSADLSEASAALYIGDLELGATLLERALCARPDHAAALHNLGAVLQNLNRLQAARWCKLGIVLQGLQSPEQPLQASVHGLRTQGRAYEAIALLQEAAASDPSLWDDLLDFGTALDLSGQYRSACKAFETALSGCDDRAEVHAKPRRRPVIPPTAAAGSGQHPQGPAA